MGYDMYTKEEDPSSDGYFRLNIWGMQIVRGAMEECGVDSGEVKMREVELIQDDEGQEIKRELEGDLYSCFSSNDGWLVTPEECEYIAEMLEEGEYCPEGTRYTALDMEQGKLILKHIPFSNEDRELVRKFAVFCKRAATLGGFYVW